MVAMMREAVEEGDLKPIDDLELAAETLTELCKVGLHPRILLGVIDSASSEDIDRIVHHAVDTFMARYGA